MHWKSFVENSPGKHGAERRLNMRGRMATLASNILAKTKSDIARMLDDVRRLDMVARAVRDTNTRLHYRDMIRSKRQALHSLKREAGSLQRQLAKYTRHDAKNIAHAAATKIQAAYRGHKNRMRALHLKYRPGGPGFEAARHRFVTLSTTAKNVVR